MCHVFVEPNLLTRRNWREQILPRMKVQLGIAKPDYASSPEGELIRARRVYTETPLVPVADWPLIEEYYLSQAPEVPLPQDPRPEIRLGLKHFVTEPPRFRTPVPTTSVVKISPRTRRIFVGDDKQQALFLLDAAGEWRVTLPLGNVPTDVAEVERGLYVTCVGSFIPSEYHRAEMLFLERQGDRYAERKVLLKELPRSTQAAFADFNGDGREDFALCMFGNLTGRFSWFENLGGDQYREHLLTEQTGAMYCYAHDFNQDGQPDLAVLMAQNLEMLILLLNDGTGQFTGRTVFQKPPVYGHSYFELADFNRDGRVDLLVTNGDNGEYESPTKRYHGIRIYLDRGELEFEEAWFFPLNGAYKAVARDFDGDGDLDLAAIAYFPDYVQSPRESFVYLENQGDLKFEPSTFRECIAGRWLVMDAADLDGDGDVDLVLGNYLLGPTPAPDFLMDIWQKHSPSIQILRNTLR